MLEQWVRHCAMLEHRVRYRQAIDQRVLHRKLFERMRLIVAHTMQKFSVLSDDWMYLQIQCKNLRLCMTI